MSKGKGGDHISDTGKKGMDQQKEDSEGSQKERRSRKEPRLDTM